jgi:hypothetical protein
MIKSKWFRQVHRWVAVAFVLSVVLVSVVLATQEQPAEWIYLSPLLPLAILAITGTVLFVQPYVARSRRPARA